MKHWEDFPVGDRQELGSHMFTEQEIVEFARQFDPQTFHTDAMAARNGTFGGLIASGWHTCAVGMRLKCEAYLGDSAGLGSPGLDLIRWKTPVRPGDTLVYRRLVLEARPSASRPGVGLVKQRWDAVNQHGELVFVSEGWELIGRRKAQ